MANVIINDKHLNDVADAIRSKAGTENKYKPNEMAEAINGLGGGEEELPDEAFVFSGDQSYGFRGGQWDWFLKKYGNRISTKDITNANSMFKGSKVEIIPFDINLKENNSYADITSIFFQNEIKKAPYIKGKIGKVDNTFQGCSSLQFIPEDWGDYIDWSYVHDNSVMMYGFFDGCSSLRKIPDSIIKNLYTTKKSSSYFYSPYYNQFKECRILEELENLPVIQYTTTNSFNDCVRACNRLGKFTFKNTDTEVEWNSNLDLSYYTGWASTYLHIINKAGITADKEVTDTESYERLKNDPDWFTSMPEYSRYNKQSAVETINSLPKTTGTSTVKFKGQAGELTDGGAINTMTEEEIAVATEKGWTVTFAN